VWSWISIHQTLSQQASSKQIVQTTRIPKPIPESHEAFEPPLAPLSDGCLRQCGRHQCATSCTGQSVVLPVACLYSLDQKGMVLLMTLGHCGPDFEHGRHGRLPVPTLNPLGCILAVLNSLSHIDMLFFIAKSYRTVSNLLNPLNLQRRRRALRLRASKHQSQSRSRRGRVRRAPNLQNRQRALRV